MPERLEIMETTSAQAIETVAKALNIPATKEAVFPFLQAAMGDDKMKLYNLALHFAKEVELCLTHDAFFAGCFMSAASVESFLALACLQEQSQVEQTVVYRHAKKKSKTYRDTVADFTFDRLIKISDELSWISHSQINQEVLSALIEDFPQLAKTVYPRMSVTEIIAKCDQLRNEPGAQIMLLIRDLRNLVHPQRWLKTDSILNREELKLNCRLAMVLGSEIISCLSVRFLELYKSSKEDLHAFEALPEEIKDLVRRRTIAGLNSSR